MEMEDIKKIMAMIEIVIKYGYKNALALFKNLEVEDPTVEQILALKVEGPEHYLGKK